MNQQNGVGRLAVVLRRRALDKTAEHNKNILGAQMPPGTFSMQPADEQTNGFDFEIGSWHVTHRRLRERLANCDEWEEFGGTSTTRAILGGNGNVEDNLLEFPDGTYRAIALRSFDPASGSWAIWWLASSDPHRLDVPVIGSFENGKGVFFADDVLRGEPVRVRFLWLRTQSESPRWEQAMSNDGGETWETNWTMDFNRV